MLLNLQVLPFWGHLILLMLEFPTLLDHYECLLFRFIKLVWNAFRLLVATTIVVKPFVHTRNRVIKSKCIFNVGDNLISVKIGFLSQMLD